MPVIFGVLLDPFFKALDFLEKLRSLWFRGRVVERERWEVLFLLELGDLSLKEPNSFEQPLCLLRWFRLRLFVLDRCLCLCFCARLR